MRKSTVAIILQILTLIIISSSLSHQQPRQKKPLVHTLLLCRHGNSIWNGGQPGTAEKFTGWTDVPLSELGVREAKNTAVELAFYSQGFNIDACFTSVLKRAKETSHYCCWGFGDQYAAGPQRYVSDWRLNERHYGNLQGFEKKLVEDGHYGHEPSDVQQWRRSWYSVPPLLEDDDPRRIEEIRLFQHYCNGSQNVPRGESLDMVARNRIRPFLDEVLHPILEDAALSRQGQTSDDDFKHGGAALVVAHANSLRALIGTLCQVDKSNTSLKLLESMKILTGVPLVLKYRFNGKSYELCNLMEGISNYDVKIIMKEFNSLGYNRSSLPVWPLSAIPRHLYYQSKI